MNDHRSPIVPPPGHRIPHPPASRHPIKYLNPHDPNSISPSSIEAQLHQPPSLSPLNPTATTTTSLHAIRNEINICQFKPCMRPTTAFLLSFILHRCPEVAPACPVLTASSSRHLSISNPYARPTADVRALKWGYYRAPHLAVPLNRNILYRTTLKLPPHHLTFCLSYHLTFRCDTTHAPVVGLAPLVQPLHLPTDPECTTTHRQTRGRP